jgi:hypothetical protein
MLDGTTEDSSAETAPDGLIPLRGALRGLALLWVAAMAAFGTLQAAVYGIMTAPLYLVLAVASGVLSVAAGYGSVRAFGLR